MTNTPDLCALVLRLLVDRAGPPADPRGHGAQALLLDRGGAPRGNSVSPGQ